MTRRRAVLAGLLALAVLGVILTRVFWDGRQALRAGDAALAAGDAREAIARWRRAARWYAPGAPHVAGAYDRLEKLARRAEQEGDPALALEAWRAIRSSSLATRSFYTPYADKLALANERIAALMAPMDQTGGTEAERQAWHLALLRKDEAPSLGWTLLALAGFATWVGGGFLFALRGITAEDKLDRRQAARAGLMVMAGMLVWMLSLYKA